MQGPLHESGRTVTEAGRHYNETPACAEEESMKWQLSQGVTGSTGHAARKYEAVSTEDAVVEYSQEGNFIHIGRIKVGLDAVVDLMVASPGFTPFQVLVWKNATLNSRAGPHWPKPIKLSPSLPPSDCRWLGSSQGAPSTRRREALSWDVIVAPWDQKWEPTLG